VPDTREELLSLILGGTVAELDITPEAFETAEERYLDVGKYLASYGADIYVQGSFMLGTVVRPFERDGEYDLDLVCLWNVRKESITQQGLKTRVGNFLHEYIEQAEGIDGDVPEACDDNRRCWTLLYEKFHMDVLPAIPDADADSDTAILLTDKRLREWQHSDPLAYVEWFRQQCGTEFIEQREVLSKAAGTVDDVPAWRVRTTLHRVVQVLKRHRDVYFGDDVDDKPPSSLITTLAALAYDGKRDLLVATLDAVHRMPSLIEIRNGVHWVANPVAEDENFADKWREYPERRVKFFQWLQRVDSDLRGALEEPGGLSAVVGRLEKAFGDTVIRKAASQFGGDMRRTREQGRMRMATTGVLSAGAAGTVVRPDHRFYGAPRPKTP
jgi:Second Messenger Oligonucleotide or Dinucleotide Synthetase domain